MQSGKETLPWKRVKLRVIDAQNKLRDTRLREWSHKETPEHVHHRCTAVRSWKKKKRKNMIIKKTRPTRKKTHAKNRCAQIKVIREGTLLPVRFLSKPEKQGTTTWGAQRIQTSSNFRLGSSHNSHACLLPLRCVCRHPSVSVNRVTMSDACDTSLSFQGATGSLLKQKVWAK